MKVLITTDWYKPVINGVVTSVVSLTGGLVALGHEVRILTLSGDRRSHIDGNVTRIGSIGVGTIYPNARMIAAISSRYVKELIDWHPDVVHSQCEFSTFFLARRISETCGCPLIHTYHTVYEDFTHYFSPSVRFGKYMAATCSRMLLAKTQTVIVPTEKIKKMLNGYGVGTPITTIPSGLELEQFEIPTTPMERKAMRVKLGLGDTDQALIYLGRLAQEKNIEELLLFLSQRQDAHLHLILVGDGPYRVHLEHTVKTLQLDHRVMFVGMVPPSEVVRYYQSGDIFVSASQSETQGLTYIEAMASGLPLVCREDSCLDGVLNNGVSGFAYHDANDFHADIDWLLSDEAHRRTMAKAARETAFGRFSSKAFAESMIQVYKKWLRHENSEFSPTASRWSGTWPSAKTALTTHANDVSSDSKPLLRKTTDHLSQKP